MHISLRPDVEEKLVALEASEDRDLNDILAEALDRYKSRNNAPVPVREAHLKPIHTDTDQPIDDIDQYFGLWAKSGHSVDGLEYQERMRSEW